MSAEYLWLVLNHLWQSTLFAAVMGVLVLLLRSAQARTRYALWLAASLKFLTPFALFMAAGSRIHWPSARTVAHTQWSAAVTQASQPFTESVMFRAAPIAAARAAGSFWIPALVLVWACGFALVVCLWFVRWRRIRAMVRRARPLPVSMPLRVLSSSALLEPSVFGIFKPVLLLPEGIEERLTGAQMEAIYAHELCHVRRRDNLVAALHMLVEALFWFHPLVWWLETRLIEERERACDEAVLQAGNPPQDYAESILEVCKLCLASPLTCAAGVSGADLKKRIESIMSRRIGQRLNTSKKALLAAVGMLAIVLPIAVGLLNPARAQERPPETFEVASIKPSDPARESIYVNYPHGGLVARGLPLNILVEGSFPGISHDFQISGAPKWFYSAKYDIEAKAEQSDTDRNDLTRKRQSAEWERTQRRIQALLEERFQLKVHREVKELPVYALVVGKNGPRFRKSKEPDDNPGFGMRWNPGHLVAHRMAMAKLADGILAYELGRTVIDKTGLNGAYDLTLTWVPDRHSGNILTDEGNALPASSAGSGPSIYSALQNQLGLKLLPAKGPVDILVIDRIEKPSPN